MHRNSNFLRSLRLQLKSGFIKEVPPAYIFMKRYPPLSRDTKVPYEKLKYKKIPYYHLFEKVADKNPIYVDEKVYPAYWQHEAQAMTLAKKQYEYIQSGMDENSAYNKAVEYVTELESENYLELKALQRNLETLGAKASFLADNNLLNEINEWKAKLEGKSYNDLELADQGEIDYLIQTKILKWNEVERERRMKDAAFVMQFEKLRNAIFPVADNIATELKRQKYNQMKLNFLALCDLEPHNITTESPFYIEDYIYYFQRLKEEPELRKWTATDRAALSKWASNTLIFKDIFERTAPFKLQSVINLIRSQYFPMLKYPDRTAEYTTPTVDDIKRILYKNDIGYKKQESADSSVKTYVERFYRLPYLLFPDDVLATQKFAEEESIM